MLILIVVMCIPGSSLSMRAILASVWSPELTQSVLLSPSPWLLVLCVGRTVLSLLKKIPSRSPFSLVHTGAWIFSLHSLEWRKEKYNFPHSLDYVTSSVWDGDGL